MRNIQFFFYKIKLGPDWTSPLRVFGLFVQRAQRAALHLFDAVPAVVDPSRKRNCFLRTFFERQNTARSVLDNTDTQFVAGPKLCHITKFMTTRLCVTSLSSALYLRYKKVKPSCSCNKLFTVLKFYCF